MPEYRFNYTGEHSGVPRRHGVPAKDDVQAFEKMSAFIGKVAGRKYYPNSMQIARTSSWQRVPDPVTLKVTA